MSKNARRLPVVLTQLLCYSPPTIYAQVPTVHHSPMHTGLLLLLTPSECASSDVSCRSRLRHAGSAFQPVLWPPLQGRFDSRESNALRHPSIIRMARTTEKMVRAEMLATL